MTTLADKLAPYATAFRRDGFVMVPDLLGADELDRYGAAVDEAVARRKRFDNRKLGDKTPYEQSFIQCINLWEDTPAVRPLTFHPVVCETAARLLGIDKLRLWHDQALYKEAGGRLTDPHQDQPYWPMVETDTITAWIPFDGSSHTTGCMGYVPGSHAVGLRVFVNIFKPEDALEILQDARNQGHAAGVCRSPARRSRVPSRFDGAHGEAESRLADTPRAYHDFFPQRIDPQE